MADISSIQLPSGSTYDVKDILGRQSIPYGIVTSDSTTVFTATVDGVTQLSNGVCCLIRNNNKQTSASGWTLNVNDLGAKPVYNNMADASRETTIYNKAYTMLFVYDEDRVDGGCWICYRGYDANTNTIGYQLRTNSTVMNVSDTARYYKLYFMSADNTMWVPASVNSTNNATAARAVNQRPINPFGRIVYTSASTNYTAGSNLAASTIWDQYALSLGYSFNRTGAALTMTVEAPVYVKCAPQADGSAIMDATTPIVQALPSTADGKIYIYLGVAYNATNIELVPHHPVYYHDGTAIRLWTGKAFATVATSGDYDDLSNKPTIPTVPTNVSAFTNDAGYLTSAPVTSVNGQTGAVTLSIPTVPSNVSAFTNDAGYLTSHQDISGKVDIAGDTMTGALIAPSFQTGSTASNYFQSQKFRGEGTADTYYHAIDFGYSGHNQVDFYEYGGIWRFHKHTAAAVDSGDTLVGKITSNGWEGSAKLTGTPTAPTASAGTNNTQIATTAFVNNAVPTKTSDLTNDSGFITSESDPVFNASAAHGITSTDITNWNNKSDFSGSYNDLTNKPTIPTVPTKLSAFTDDLGSSPTHTHSQYLTSYTESDPTVPSWAKASSKPSYTKSEVGLGNVDNVKQYSASNPPPYPVTSVNGSTGAVTVSVPTKVSDLTNDSGFITGMTILSYGNSTWADFEAAYNANKVVYCRASSNANPASGSQTRLAFMAYVNNATTPTNVEFQYYRSVSSHTASQQGDQVFVYKLDKTSGWSVTTREASVKVVAGDGLGGTYSNGTMTLAVSGAIPSEVTATTQTSTDNSTKIATTAFVKTAIDNAGLWEQGVDANDQPVAGAIKAKDYVDTDDVSRTNSAPWTGDFVAGGDNTATGNYAVIAGRGNTANAYSTTIGDSNTAAGGGGSTLLGNSNQATSGTWGFATGVGNTISHNNTVAMGWYNTASNYNAIALGRDNTASGNSSSAIGYGNTASETAAHAEGRNTTASGKGAHSEGYATEASGCQSHAEGHGTLATARYNHVFGEYNISDPGFTAADARGTYIEIVGNGADAQNRNNARTLDWSGNEWIAGLVSVGSSSTPPTPTANNHLTTKKYVDDIVGDIETLLASI